MKSRTSLITFGLTVLVVMAVLLSACAGQTPAPPTQTEEPAAQVEPEPTAKAEEPTPTAAPQEEEPAAEEPGAKSAADVRVAVVPGGPHPYFAPMEPGLADAVADFGLGDSEFKSPSEWTLNAQNQLLNSMAAQGYNAFAIFPGDVNGTNGAIDELKAQGNEVIVVAGCVNEPTQASFCLATDVAQSAYLGTKALIEALGGEGKIIHGTGFLVDPNTQLRIEAVQKAVDETGGKVELVQTLADIDSQEEADRVINSFLAAQGDEIDGIVTSAYVPSTVSATALRNLGDKRIKMVGIDDDPIVLDAIREGFLVGTMAQNPYGQAYVGSYILENLAMGCEPKSDAPYFVDSGTLLISEENIGSYQEDLKALTKQIATEFKDKYLNCP